jgi:hypothetical protein
MWINFKQRRGYVTNTSGDLVPFNEKQHITIEMRQSIGGGKFTANFSFKGKAGRFEAALLDNYWLDIDFTGSVSTSCKGEPLDIEGGDSKLAQMSREERLNAAAHLALDKMPADIAQQISGMLTPQSFGIMSATFGIAIAGQVYGGPVALATDLILLTVGVYLMGPQVLEAGENLIEFWSSATNAQSDEDLDVAATAFSRLVAAIGVNALAAILFGKADKAFKDKFVKPKERAFVPGSIKRPTTPGRWLWDADSVKVDFKAELPPETEGSTTVQGKILINKNLQGMPLAQLRALAHERVHQLITRLASLTQLTFDVRVWAYERSYLFRYLEETLAEFYASRVMGEPVLDSFQFAIKNGYIEVRRWAAGLHELAENKANQKAMRAARKELKSVNEMIVDKEQYSNRQEKFFRDLEQSGGRQGAGSTPRIKDLYARKSELESSLKPLDDLMNNFINVPAQLPDGRASWSTLRMKSYVDGDPMMDEGGHLVGMFTVSGTFFQVFFSITRPGANWMRPEVR